MRHILIILLGATCILTTGCIGLSFGGTRTVGNTAGTGERPAVSVKDYDLSPEAEAAFLNDPEVGSALHIIDFHGTDTFIGKDALRTLEKKAATYRAQHPKKQTTDDAEVVAPGETAAGKAKTN